MVKINAKLVDFKIDDPRLELFIYYMQTADAINRFANILFYKEGISFIKFIVLVVLKLNGGTLRPTDIARWTFRERHDITTLIRRLEKEGLVKIERNMIDRRAIDVSLTDKGKQTLERVDHVSRELPDQIVSSLTDQQVAQLEELIGILRQNAENGLEDINSSR